MKYIVQEVKTKITSRFHMVFNTHTTILDTENHLLQPESEDKLEIMAHPVKYNCK